MSSIELPLVLFTVACQAAVGIALMLAMADSFFPALVNGAKFNRFRMAGMSIVVLVAISAFFSVFHLGKPLEAYKALLNLGTSMLSLEIVALMVVGLLALVYAYLWWKSTSGSDSGLRKPLGAVLALCGIATVIVSSRIYTLPARLPWDSWQTTAAFLLSALLIGAMVFCLLAEGKAPEVGEKSQEGKSRFFAAWVLIAAALIVYVMASFSGTYSLSSEQATAVTTTLTSSWFYVRLVVGLLLPAAAALSIFFSRAPSRTLVALAVCGAVVGELIGRAQFYHSVMGQLV